MSTPKNRTDLVRNNAETGTRWTARLRCRISKSFTSDETELHTSIGGRKCTISSGENKSFKLTDWITFEFHEFHTEHEAACFGKKFLDALMLSGVLNNFGIDAGENRATCVFGEIVINAIAKAGGKLLPNIHGLAIYKNDGNELFFQFKAIGTVTQDPNIFTEMLTNSFKKVGNITELERLALTLLSLSKIATDPLTQATLAISAVEALSASPPWTSTQQRLIDILKENALSYEDASPDEKREVADGLDRIFKVSVRQSIKRKMRDLGFGNTEWKEFDEAYDLRSRIFHDSLTGRDHHLELSTKAHAICSKIIIAAII